MSSKPGAASVIIADFVIPKVVPLWRKARYQENDIEGALRSLYAALTKTTVDDDGETTTVSTYDEMADILNDRFKEIKVKVTPETLAAMVEPKLRGSQPLYPGMAGARAGDQLQSMFWEHANVTDKRFGGAVPKRTGGDVTTDSTMYVPTSLTVDRRVAVERPCGFQEREVVGPMYWQTQCDRTDQAGVQDCKLVPVASKVRQIIPATCTESQFSVLKGVDLQTQKVTDVNGRVISVQTVAKPVVERYKQVVAVKPGGQPITYERLQRAGEAAEGPYNPPSLIEASNGTGVTGRDLGGGSAAAPKPTEAKRTGGEHKDAKSNVKRAGAIDMPESATKMMLNETDLDNQVLPVPEGMIERPSAWSALNPTGGPHFNMYDDSYGTTSAKTRQFGFPFKRHHLSYDRLKFFKHNTSYLEWLISVSYKLRAEYSESYKYNYDAVIDTEATLESQILNGIGKLEAKRKFFDRLDIFAGSSAIDKREMHPIIRKYVDTPRTDIWFSPLTHRYLEMGDGNSYPNEQVTLDNVNDLYRAISNQLREGYASKSGDRVVLPVPFPKVDIEMTTMAFAEDYLMALLERLQYVGYAFNTNFGTASAIVTALLSPEQRKYLREEAIKYLELFRLEAADKPFYYLPGIRRLMAREHGVELPKAQGFEVGPDWRPIRGADMPVVVEGIPVPAEAVVANEASFYEKMGKKRSSRRSRR